MFSKSRPVKKEGTGDREWLYEEVLKFIKTPSQFDLQLGREPRPKSDRDIWTHFASIWGTSTGRKSYDSKKRSVKRAMLRSALARLVADGRIKVANEETLNLKTMNGSSRRSIEHRRQMFGKEFDDKVRTYEAIDVLEGIVQALEASE